MEGYNLNTPLVVLTVAVLFCTNMGACSCSNTANTFQTSLQFIKTSCNKTLYQSLCVNSLSSYTTKIKTSYRKLAYTALSLTLKNAKSVSSALSKLSKQSKLKSSEVAAMNDCVENIADSIYELKQSLMELKNLNATDLDYKLSNIMTWVSAALTDDDTCLDGLDEESVNGETKETIKKNVLTVGQMTSNVLALVNNVDHKQLYKP